MKPIKKEHAKSRKNLNCGLFVMALLFFVVSMFSVPQLAFAQQVEDEKVGMNYGPRKQMATIIFSGLAGAVLGLSTLSFYGRPQDKLSNIAVGFAVGIIAGTVYTTYKTATKRYDQFEESRLYNFDDYKNYAIYEFEEKHNPKIKIGYSWDF